MSVLYITSNEEQAQTWDWEYLARQGGYLHYGVYLFESPESLTYIVAGLPWETDLIYVSPTAGVRQPLQLELYQPPTHERHRVWLLSEHPPEKKGTIEVHMMRWKDIHGEYYKRVREWIRREEKFLPPKLAELRKSGDWFALLVEGHGDATSVIGYAKGNREGEKTAFLSLLEISPEWRGRGLCTKFVDYIFRQLLADGYSKIELINVGGIPADRCYRRAAMDNQLELHCLDVECEFMQFNLLSTTA